MWWGTSSPALASFPLLLSRQAEDAVVRRIEERIAEWSHIPVENGEGIQVLRYEHGQARAGGGLGGAGPDKRASPA